MSTSKTARRFLPAVVVAVALASLVAACGSDDDGTTAPADDGTTAPADDGTTAPADDGTTAPADDGTTAPADDGTTAPADDGTTAPADEGGRSASLAADFENFTTAPDEIPITEPHSQPAPEGLSIVYITCGLPTCTTIANSVEAAADVLGWEFTALGSEPTPEAIKEAWGQAVRLAPDAVLASGFPRTIFEPELQQLNAMGVGVFECCSSDEAGDGITMSVVRPDDEAVQGQYTAAVAATFAEGTPNVLFVNLPEFAAIQPQYDVFVEKLEEYAPGAQQAKIDIPNTAIGTTSASTIVAYLRSHPEVNFVALSQDALSTGLAAEMQAAGVDVPFSGNGGGPQPRELVASGEQAATIEFPIDQVFWTLVDAVVRWKNGDDFATNEQVLTPPPYFIITPDNVETTPDSIVADLAEQYAELWGR